MRHLLRRFRVALLLGAASCGDGGGSGIPGGAPTAAPIPAPAPTLGVPGGLRVSATGSDFIEWSWEAVEGAASYEIQVSTAAGDFGAAVAATVTATMHRFAVAPGMTAHARVRALAAGIESDWSAAVMGTSDTASLGIPVGLRVSATGSDFIEWSWEAVEGAAIYEIQVSTAGDFGAAMTTTVTATMHRFAVPPGTTAHARVRALATGVESDWSAAVMGTSDAAPVTVSFVGEGEPLRVEEGETVEIRVQVAELAAPLSLAISPLAGTAEAEDYELSATVIEIPAGSGGDETTALSFTAVSDRAIAEGEETLVLRFVPPEGVPAQLGGDLEVVIAEGGAKPCPGVAVEASPVAAYSDGAWDRGGAPGQGRTGGYRTTLVTEWSAGSEEVVFDWLAPYAEYAFIPGGGVVSVTDEFSREIYSIFHARIRGWRAETIGQTTRHEMRIEWPSDLELGIRFRYGSCSGDQEVVCGEAGCDWRP